MASEKYYYKELDNILKSIVDEIIYEHYIESKDKYDLSQDSLCDQIFDTSKSLEELGLEDCISSDVIWPILEIKLREKIEESSHE